MDKFLNNLASEKKKVIEVETSHIGNYHDELSSNYDEEKLLNKMINHNQKMTRVKWINFRYECLQHVSNGECSMKFCENFIKLLDINDQKYNEENKEFLVLLKNFVLWKQKMIDIDVIINSLSNLHERQLTMIENNNESLMYQRKMIFEIIEDLINTHGSSPIIKLRKSFEIICEKSHDYELLFILWTKLFER